MQREKERAGKIAAESFVWLLASLCQLNRVAFDADLVTQRFPAPHDQPQLLEALASLGFTTGEFSGNPERLDPAALPCIGFLEDAQGDAAPALVVKADGERVLYFAPAAKEPLTVSSAEFARLGRRPLILARYAERLEIGLEDGAGAEPRFGFRWFWNEIARHKAVWRDVLLASLFIQLVGLATPLFTQVIIDKVVVHRTTSTLAVVAIGLAVFLLFNAGMSWLRQYLVLHTGNRVDAVLASEVFRHLLRLYLPYFERRPTGVLIARLRAVETVREFMAGAAISLVLDLPFLVVFLAVMFFYSWALTLIALAILGLISLISILVVPRLRARINRQFLLGARNQAFLTEYVAGIETVKSLQMEPRLQSRYEEMLAQYLAAGFDTRQTSNTYGTLANALEQAMTLMILCAGALLVMRNDGFTIGMLVAFQMFASRLSQPVLRLAGLWQELQQASIAVARLGDIMDAPAEPQSLAPSRSRERRGAIELQGLAFRYSAEHPFLYRNLSFAFPPGKLTVLTGPSGCGKSTLAKLLLGFYRPEDGRILVDGRDIRHFSANELRSLFGVVPQETVLFSGSIYENVVAGNPNASFEDVVQACRTAEIHDFIEALPQGYRSEIGEHGVGLSGGQKQRLAIARALLKRPQVLIFDEATSALDRATAERFAQTVNRLKGAASILFIAHQLPGGLAADGVFTLGGGA